MWGGYARCRRRITSNFGYANPLSFSLPAFGVLMRELAAAVPRVETEAKWMKTEAKV
ncbi:hypothetical protein SCP_0803300 [Sparassis crispa]|uniref:Uncharacterized protein n=1 Tax=Sparassis crispa TaxID=139825 RepID=A0A401GUB3_9APHY|nr:hypothetical protein SCP_0803300 [Sparassis crispa]GBE85808.1 hypothetical protein SCP_0803300 [Sparassis crispa]